MANQWLRLWHDMPTDPKWRTIAKASGERIGDVMAVYVHLLVCASNADERGRTHSFNCEDVASALDVETEQVAAIVAAMQGRVLDGDAVAGWDKRQVAREDGAAERAKAWREQQKAKQQAELNAAERNRTQAERKQTPDKDTDTEESREGQEKRDTKPPAPPWVTVAELEADGLSAEVASAWIAHRRTRKAKLTALAWKGFKSEVVKAGWELEAAVLKAITRNWIAFEGEWLRNNPPATTGKHAGFASKNYREGIEADGSLL